jgi:hypothetical protein
MDRSRAFRHHLFILVGLLGCIAPGVTPRLFPVRQLPPERVIDLRDFDEYRPPSGSLPGQAAPDAVVPPEGHLGSGEIVQFAC